MGFLVLTRRRDEDILIGDSIVIRIVDIRGDKVRIGIDAPTSLAVHRREVYEQINGNAAQSTPLVEIDRDKMAQPAGKVRLTDRARTAIRARASVNAHGPSAIDAQPTQTSGVCGKT